MDFSIREMRVEEYPLLKEFLYQAIFQRDENALIPRSVLNDPSIAVYIRDFGKEEDDLCLCAEVETNVIGAVWVRNIEGFGSIDARTPEFALSLYPTYRGYGIGTALMRRMLERLEKAGYKQASLAVQKENAAKNMYLRLGFEICAENEEEFIMVYRFG
jgi:ribosomal protein S18 acetylase RimI-like enzyme